MSDPIEEAVKNALQPKSKSKSSGGGGSSQAGFQAQYEQSLGSVYMGLWGVAPPPGYVKRIAASHMNLFEFEAHERAKPAFDRSIRYQEERVQTELELARRFGALG